MTCWVVLTSQSRFLNRDYPVNISSLSYLLERIPIFQQFLHEFGKRWYMKIVVGCMLFKLCFSQLAMPESQPHYGFRPALNADFKKFPHLERTVRMIDRVLKYTVSLSVLRSTADEGLRTWIIMGLSAVLRTQ